VTERAARLRLFGMFPFELRAFCVVALLSPLAPLTRGASAPEPPPKTVTVDLGRGVAMEFVLIPAGSFVMGSDEHTGEGDESPAHRVTVSRPFYLGKTEVTQEQWTAVMGDNPSAFRGAKLPVEHVSWNDCQRFIAKLSAKAGRSFALPTEAQWEYACRGGTTTPWSFGKHESAAGDHAWLGENSGGGTHPVATKASNAWGLHDMHGNVWEWCSDWYAKHAYDDKNVIDPTGPAAATGSRVLRGGAWGDAPEGVRSAVRNCLSPAETHDGIGFRCVMQTAS
jgi:formylglycine-generating enzyme required for sulfatase activity